MTVFARIQYNGVMVQPCPQPRSVEIKCQISEFTKAPFVKSDFFHRPRLQKTRPHPTTLYSSYNPVNII